MLQLIMNNTFIKLFCVFIILFCCCKKTNENNQNKVEIIKGFYVAIEKVGEIYLEEKEGNLIGLIHRFEVNLKYKNILITDPIFSEIKVYNNDGKPLRIIGKKGSGPGEFKGIVGITQDSLYIYAVDAELRRIYKFNREGDLISSINSPSSIYLSPGEIMIRENKMYISTFEAKYKPVDETYKVKPIAVMDTSGNILYHFGNYDDIYKKFRINWSTTCFDIDDRGNTYLTNYVSWKIFKYDQDERLTLTLGVKGNNFLEMKESLKGGETRAELNKIFIRRSSVMKMEVADYVYFQYTNTTEKALQTRSRLDYHHYLMVYTKDGVYIQSDIKLPGGGMLDVDNEGIIYIELSDEPGNRIIGKYKIKIVDED
ncbi:MAG: 6-bladed beta-propeller [Bacteroidota bacterium]|nr:6-bladed beta-propeller [Bacteroidota bacterium]